MKKMNMKRNTDTLRNDEKTNKRALIAMSGGVDSSVAAALMKERGYDCIGVTMKLYDNGEIGVDTEKTCCSLDDIEDARSVASKIGIPYYVFNFRDDFEELVIKRFVEAYEQGLTPNPCIDCNRFIKFKRLFLRARELGCDSVATGHYARVEKDEKSGRYVLKKAVDPGKDQSYVLYSLTQDQLAMLKLPLGDYKKSEARSLAEELGFVNAAKKDSQDICFVPDGDYAGFISGYTGKDYPPGDFLDTDGNVIGMHEGIIRYTIGQRKGLKGNFKRPAYVCAKDAEKNSVTLGENDDLFSRELHANDINLITCERIEGQMRVSAKVRYSQPEQPAVVTQEGDDLLRIVFEKPQRAVTKGQAAVLYDGETVVGGGTIV